jgi:endoglucanase|eukprot:6237989-Prymnesium_polylepis.2
MIPRCRRGPQHHEPDTWNVEHEEQPLLEAWTVLAARYCETQPHVIAADLFNEPFAATWGDEWGEGRDWPSAAERLGSKRRFPTSFQHASARARSDQIYHTHVPSPFLATLPDHVLRLCPRWLVVVEGVADWDGAGCEEWGCCCPNIHGQLERPVTLELSRRLVLSPHVYGAPPSNIPPTQLKRL